jgi:hypothetical protein
MNPLIGIAAGVVPDIIKLIAGDSTGQLAEQVGKAVADTVGTTNASDAQTKLAANPAAQNALRQKLAELALDATKAQNADAGQRAQEALANTQSARSGLQALATTNSTIAWTAPTISYLVIGGFFIFLFVLVSLYWGKPADNQNNFIVQIINIAVGALTAAFVTARLVRRLAKERRRKPHPPAGAGRARQREHKVAAGQDHASASGGSGAGPSRRL